MTFSSTSSPTHRIELEVVLFTNKDNPELN